MKRVDLHLHSTASDGRLDPAGVVRAAARNGVVGMALTDHDTVEGSAAARAEAERLGLGFLLGSEMSANQPERSVHLLAYGFDPRNPGVVRFFEDFREDRLRRAASIVSHLNALGVSLTLDAVLEVAGPGVPTRAHIARALVAGGWVDEIGVAFDRYIARGKPAFVEKKPTPPDEVFALVHEAGGVVLLAHPGTDFTADEIRDLVAAGLDGLEVLHPRNTAPVRRVLEELVEEYGLLRGGGSDWHGPDSGRAGPGSEPVPANWMREIRERCEA